MSDVIIRAQDLSKIYRLYAKPQYRFLDMFGLLPQKPDRFSEHKAVNSVSMEIGRGEKVAIIGRNGAGKSTLLKLITGVIEPSNGTIDVFSRVHALLQIGTGFHPDFTGRENIYSYLAQLGVTGKKADAKVTDIVEFAELEEYIDQPIKTYSTGMAVRLMFSASTSIAPDILVLDEVLGVGDAYFSQKSYQKIKSLCDVEGTTLLLVTHDLYSAMNVCNRFIWIEKGQVIADGDADTIIHQYEASIREQEERRLRDNHIRTMEENRRKLEASDDQVNIVYGHLRTIFNQPVDEDIPVESIEVEIDGESYGRVFTAKDNGEKLQLLLERDQNSWSEPENFDGRELRKYSVSGSIYHRAPFTLLADKKFLLALGEERVTLTISYFDSAEKPCCVDVVTPFGTFTGLLENRADACWKNQTLRLTKDKVDEYEKGEAVRWGSQALAITEVKFLNSDGEEGFIFSTGETLKIRMSYVIRDPEYNECPRIAVVFIKGGTNQRTHRFILENQRFNYKDKSRGEIELKADPLMLGPGEYLISIMVLRESAFKKVQRNSFYTANEQLLDAHNRAYKIVVQTTEDDPLKNDVIFYHPCSWRKDGKQQAYSDE